MNNQKKHERWYMKLMDLVSEILNEHFEDVDEDVIVDVTNELHEFIMQNPMPSMMDY